MEVDDSVTAVMGKIDAASKEHLSGEFISFDDTPMKW